MYRVSNFAFTEKRHCHLEDTMEKIIVLYVKQYTHTQKR